MADFDQWGGADPVAINKALEAQGSTYRVPVPVAPPVSGPAVIDTAPFAGQPVQPLTPEEQALGAQLVKQREQADAVAAANPSHAPAPQPAVTSAAPATPGIDWKPSVQSQAVPPGARMSLAQPNPQLSAPQYAPTNRPHVGGGVANPIPNMLKDASSGRATAESLRDDAEIRYDTATEARKYNAETLGDSKANALDQIAERQARLAAEQDEYNNRLQIEGDAHQAATDKVTAERNEMNKFVSDYEPKDRRSMNQRVAGAIAVGLGGMLDQNNLVAGLMQGMNVQTNNADRAASLISRGIDRDLEYQRQLLDNKRTAMAGKTTEMGQLREKYGDAIDVLKLGRAMKLEQAQTEIQSITSKGASAEARQLGQEVSDKLEADKQALYSQVYGERFEKLSAEEKQLRMARYQQQMAQAAGGGTSDMQRLKLQEQALKNKKLEQELNKTDKGGPATEGERKTYGVIAGTKDAYKRLYSTVYNNNGTQKDPDSVDMPARAWDYVPGLLTPEQKEQERLDDVNLTRTLLRIESGSNVPDSEVEGKMHSTGLTSSDESVRAKARKTLLDQVAATDQWGLLDDARPNALVRPHGSQ